MVTVRDDLTAGVITGRVARWLSDLRGWFMVGTLLSALGFALPWFRVSTGYSWWYGG